MNISAVIICHNEAENISTCLHSLVGVVDEVIVVDSGSRDGTQDIAKRHNAIVYQRLFDDYATQKNWANGKASHAWILSIDADEALSEALKASLLQLRSTDPIHTAYAMNRRNFLGNQAILHGSWYPDKKIRLFRNTEALWGNRNPHEVLQLQPKLQTTQLRGDILHRSHKNIKAFRAKNTYYAQLMAKDLSAKGKVLSLWIAALKAAFRFTKEYFLLRGFLDGLAGWQIACANAHYTWLKYYLVIEKKNKYVR